jgi:hypothetical protein
MLYPVNFLKNLGKTILQIDFIGPRYLKGNSKPLHFISLKYTKPFKLHIFIRIKSQTTTEALNSFYILFFVLKLPIPNVVQMDNDSAFRGCIEKKGRIGRIIIWLCNNGIIPLFNATSSPWNNGSVEGGNSVFDKKFWQAFQFTSAEEVDQKLEEFNNAYQTYLINDRNKIIQNKRNVSDPRTNTQIKKFLQKNLYLLRIVKEQYDKCYVEVLNFYINLPAQYKGQFVIIKILLDSGFISIYQEIEEQLVLIKTETIFIQK